MNLDVDVRDDRPLPRGMDRTRADVERSDLRRAVLGGRDRGDTAAGAQVGDSTSARQPSLIHDVDQQLRVFLRGVDAFGDDRFFPVGVGSGQRRPFEQQRAYRALD